MTNTSNASNQSQASTAPDVPTLTLSKVSAPSVLLLGDPGRGKTYSLGTLAADSRVEKFFYLYTDPGGDESLIDSLRAHNVPIDKVHFCYIPPISEGWETLEQLATKVNTMDYEALSKIKSGINKRGNRQMYNLIEALGNFKCDRTGESFGASDLWPDTYALAFDSLTGLNAIAKGSTVGAKPSLHQGEWGVAMSMEETLIRKFTASIKCPRVMVGHMDKQKDEYTGRMTFMVSLLGNKLAPNIPSLFSDVVHCYSEGSSFKWATVDDRISLKARNLPLGSKLAPDFKQILDSWYSRREYASGR